MVPEKTDRLISDNKQMLDGSWEDSASSSGSLARESSMNDPCTQCDNIGQRNVFLRQQYQGQRSDILPVPPGKPLFKGVQDIPKLIEGPLKLLAEATFEGICVHDQSVILDANSQFCDMFGYPSGEMKGMNCFTLIAPQSQEMVRHYISTGFRGPYQAYCLRKHGSVFPVEVCVREFQQEGTNLHFAVFRDLTEHQEKERRIAEIENKYRQLYQDFPIALFRIRISDELLLECNRALVELFGYGGIDEIRSAGNFTAHYLNSDEKTVFLKKLTINKRVERFQIQFRCRYGHTLWVEATAEIFPEQDCIEGSMQNITAFKVLSKAERKVLRMILEGRSNIDIARASGRSIRTIEDHRANIMKKLGANNVVELIQKAKSLRPEP